MSSSLMNIGNIVIHCLSEIQCFLDLESLKMITKKDTINLFLYLLLSMLETKEKSACNLKSALNYTEIKFWTIGSYY